MAQIIKLPHPDFNFEPYEFGGGSMLAAYDRDRTLVEIVDSVLRLDVPAMRCKVAGFSSVVDRPVEALIADIEAAGKSYEALSALFECAVARLSAVDAKLV